MLASSFALWTSSNAAGLCFASVHFNLDTQKILAGGVCYLFALFKGDVRKLLAGCLFFHHIAIPNVSREAFMTNIYLFVALFVK